ncbi:MAG: histidine--tRNA ligase [Candidatus Aenigmarchaeota archaeon]|nr:histidine--tRNA ligase [Candidatus Aenigmarchaeota archaeon]
MTDFQTPRGTRDFLPKDALKRQIVLEKIRRIFELWGFDPLETPAFEEWRLLAAKSGGGEAIREEVYYFKDKSERELGLRFDLTVPTARVVAINPNIPKPFKRYQIGNVWRYDRPGAGRYREFTQADIDIFGSSMIDADALVVGVACNCLYELGFKDFIVRLNSRKLIEKIVLSIGVEQEKVIDIFRSIDKLEKIGEDGVRDELQKKGFELSVIKNVLKLISFNLDTLKSKGFIEDIQKLEDIVEKVKDFGYDNVKIDISLVRGLEYYTDSVFEVILPENKALTITAGGRYDNLIEVYGGKSTPAVGISLGIDRIIFVMEERNMFNEKETNARMFLVSIGDSSKVNRQVIRLSSLLRKIGIPNEYDIMSRSLSKQLDYINTKNIPYAIIVGEKELDRNVVKLKDMKSGEEQELSIAGFEKEIGKLVD